MSYSTHRSYVLTKPALMSHFGATALYAFAGLVFSAQVAAQSTVARVVEYTYNATTGLLELERVDPGGTHCVETIHTHDAYGNKATTEVKPCAVGPTAATTFEARKTVFTYALKTTGGASQSYPAGAYLTSTTLLNASGTLVSKSEFDYDPRFGGVSLQTEVAHVSTANNNTKRTVYDAFGRVFQEYVPVGRTTTTTTESFIEHERVYCDGPFKATTADPLCINYEATDIPTQVDSWMLSDRSTGAVLAKQSANTAAAAVSAYYIRSTPKSGTAVIGGRTITHFDSLHRGIAKESEAYDGKWSTTLAAFNNLGMEVVKWSPYFGRTSATAALTTPPVELRQWTARFDLLHRPVKQSQYWRNASAAAATVVNVEMTYAGLSSAATIPADSSPDGVARVKTAIKNAHGKVAQAIDPYGATVNYAYDAVGNLVRTWTPWATPPPSTTRRPRRGSRSA
jgi:YD repeat-containing protein